MSKHIEPDTAVLLAATLAMEGGPDDICSPAPSRAARDAVELVRLERRAKARATRDCNGYRDAVAQRRDHAAHVRDLRRVEAILSTYGAMVASYQDGDPRGSCLVIKLASGRSRGWTSGLWAV